MAKKPLQIHLTISISNSERHVAAVPRTRKQTITSMNSEWTMGGGSRANLANQLSRISVRSYAQSLSRLSQMNPSLMTAGESMASVAISVSFGFLFKKQAQK